MWFLKKKKQLPFDAALNDDQEPGINIFSPTWKSIRAWAVVEIEDAKERNCSTKRTEVETAVIRGEIRKLKDLLELPTNRAGNTSGILNTAFTAGKE